MRNIEETINTIVEKETADGKAMIASILDMSKVSMEDIDEAMAISGEFIREWLKTNPRKIKAIKKVHDLGLLAPQEDLTIYGDMTGYVVIESAKKSQLRKVALS